MKKMELYTMLVQNDQTVSNALEVFQKNKQAKTNGWGCKDIGISPNDIKELVKEMKKTGKKVYLEIMADTVDDCRTSAKFAVDCDFDVALGGHYDQQVASVLANSNIEYYPFIGDLAGTPRVLQGTIEEIVQEAISVANKEVTGITMAVYRFKGDQEKLLQELVANINKPIIVAGSVNTEERIKQLAKAKISGITIGTSFFKQDFIKNAGFEENVNQVIDWIDEVN